MKAYCLVLISVLSLAFSATAQNKYLPNQLTVQHAGGIGWFSVGLGYKNASDKWNASLHYGYVPPNQGGRLDIFSLKAGYNPVNINITPKILWKPVNPVVFISYTTNKYFYTSWPSSRYPDDYYWWSSAFRTNIGLQTSFTFALPEKACSQSATLYVEVSSNDLYISSYMSNRKELSLLDISVLAAGIKLNFK